MEIESLREKKGKSMEIENNLHVPEDWILEILLRLPLQSLVRFKCVCKSWLSLISNPDFAKSHFELAARPSHRLLRYESEKVHFMDPNASFHDDPSIITFDFPPQIESGYDVVQSCRGFILLADETDFVIWNPSTKEQKRISYAHIVSCAEIFSLIDIELLGFGYDASKDDYLIVAAWFDDDGESQLEYFSVRTNSWMKLEASIIAPYMDPGFRSSYNSNAFLNGALHWFAWANYHVCILAFDLIERNVSMIGLPKPAEWYDSSIFKVAGDYLVMCYKNEDKFEVWILKEYKIESSWTVFEFDTDFEPIWIDKCGDFIGIHHNEELVRYNDKGELLERRACCDYWSTMHVESLLSLPCDSGRAGENDQRYKTHIETRKRGRRRKKKKKKN